MDKPFLSVIMPALNEEKNIRDAIFSVVRELDSFGIKGEIVVINDGSNDKTPDLAMEMMKSEKRIRLINHNIPKGVGMSFWDGVDASEGEIVCMLPGDNENDPKEIFRYLKLLDDVDIVVPFVYNRCVRSHLRNVLSRLYIFIINATFGLSFNYTNGTVLCRRAILKELGFRSRSFFFQTDILVRLAKIGYLFSEVPYSLRSRKAGSSKAVSIKSFKQIVSGYIGLFRYIYFSREIEHKKYHFAEGSLSKKRYGSAQINE